ELEKRSGIAPQKAKVFEFKHNSDRYGRQKGTNGKWNYTPSVEGGRAKDDGEKHMKTALKEIATIHTGDFRLTGNQNLVIGNVEIKHKLTFEQILEKYSIDSKNDFSPIRLNSMACVALNTCSLAFAHAENYLPSL